MSVTENVRGTFFANKLQARSFYGSCPHLDQFLPISNDLGEAYFLKNPGFSGGLKTPEFDIETI